ncbi:hypothetical protein DS831_04615 [Bombilactobacillus bombi]|uniref:DUF1642 domain-containing protein n=1 Tax=Bombilactobacillus bombi TaxID=1303590 RepID=A0A3R6ZYN1_9LACO|nr:hypothetical protein [Bombilactobacillus bombi]RHW51307.1 hypothetical protein DS831_04615 [Bombilactobacillus bombi]
MNKVKVPKFMVNEIVNDVSNFKVSIDRRLKDSFSKFIRLREDLGTERLTDADKWIINNPSKYVLARENGYEVAEYYYIKFSFDTYDTYLKVVEPYYDFKIDFYKVDDKYQSTFTMEEIEKYLPQFKQFAVKVGDDDGCDD